MTARLLSGKRIYGVRNATKAVSENKKNRFVTTRSSNPLVPVQNNARQIVTMMRINSQVLESPRWIEMFFTADV